MPELCDSGLYHNLLTTHVSWVGSVLYRHIQHTTSLRGGWGLDDISVDDTSVDYISVDGLSVNDVSVEEVSADDAPADDLYVDDVSLENV